MQFSAPVRAGSAWFYLTVLLLGYTSAGWLLAAFGVSWLVWVGTQIVILHLIRAEADAIALASAWVVGIISVAAVVKAWTPVWNSRLPFEQAQLWALGLLLLWLWAILLVLLLAFAPKSMRSIGFSSAQTFSSLLLLAATGLASGWFIYHRFS